jgi:hypothetical protein
MTGRSPLRELAVLAVVHAVAGRLMGRSASPVVRGFEPALT